MMEQPKTAKEIPSVMELRKQLDYGDLTLPRCQTFRQDTRTFRGKFLTSREIKGSDCYLWTGQSHRQGLDEMTDAFLQCNGMLYWPDDPASPRHNRWQYSKHHKQIGSLIYQLFFRLNEQQRRNLSHKQKHDGKKKSLKRIDDSSPTAQIIPNITSGSPHNPPARIGKQTTNNWPVDPRAQSKHEDVCGVPRRAILLGLNEVSWDNSTLADNHESPYKRMKILESGSDKHMSVAQQAEHTKPTMSRTLFSPRAWGASHNLDMATNLMEDARHVSPTTLNIPSDVPIPTQHSPSELVGNVRSITPSSKESNDEPALFSPIVQEDVQQTPSSSQCSPTAATLTCQGDERPTKQATETIPGPVSFSAGDELRRTPALNSRGASSHPELGSTAGRIPSMSEAVPRSASLPAMFDGSVFKHDASQYLATCLANVDLPTHSASTMISNKPIAVETRSMSGISLLVRACEGLPREIVSTHVAERSSHTPPMELPTWQKLSSEIQEPTIAFMYRIIYSRNPSFVVRQWVPKKPLKRMTLAEFRQELPLNLPPGAKGWLFKLIAPGLYATYGIQWEQDDEYNQLLQFIDRMVRIRISQRPQQRRFEFALEIETLMEQDYSLIREEEYEGVFDF